MNALHHNQRGLSLVEVTIMLLVLMLLTSVLAPSIADFVNDARWVKVKEDCEAIGLSVARLTRDVGPCLKFAGTQACTKQNRVDLLHSDGTAIDAASLGAAAVPVVDAANLASGQLNWDTVQRDDSMDNQFVTNAAAYATPTGMTVGPLFGLGWRGAYLSPPIGPDPWGHRYMVNSAFLAVATDGAGPQADLLPPSGGRSLRLLTLLPPPPPPPSGPWTYNTFCISAGPNGSYDTPIGGNANGGVTRTGDDFVTVIAGAGH
ncbi:MAG: hypothetical protein WCP29_17380 [Acidobacteriota bacterium]